MERSWFRSLAVRGLTIDLRQRSICQQSQVGRLMGQEASKWQQQLSIHELMLEREVPG